VLDAVAGGPGYGAPPPAGDVIKASSNGTDGHAAIPPSATQR
jgi:hypothetical protein